MVKQPVSAQPLLSNGARGQKGATAVADAVESPRTAGFDRAGLSHQAHRDAGKRWHMQHGDPEPTTDGIYGKRCCRL